MTANNNIQGNSSYWDLYNKSKNMISSIIEEKGSVFKGRNRIRNTFMTSYASLVYAKTKPTLRWLGFSPA